MVKRKTGSQKTRRLILDFLKRKGAMDAVSLATILGISAMAVRQHLYDLADQGFVDFHEISNAVGRPAKKWSLTTKADIFFPNAHAALSVELLQALKVSQGDEGLDKLISARNTIQITYYNTALATYQNIRDRVEALAGLRTEEGYLAEKQELESGEILLIENHCPICTAAKACPKLCTAELDVFKTVLGENVKIDRVEHLVSGARRCMYVITDQSIQEK